MGRSRAIHRGSERRRQTIIEAALRCFLETGYEATTMEEIVHSSGASVGSIYHHFGGKEALAAAVYLEGIADYQQGMVAALRQTRSARTGVEAIIAHHLRWVEQNPDWSRFLNRMRHMGFMARAEPGMAARNAEWIEAVVAWVRRQVASGALRRMPPELYFSILLGPTQDVCRRWLAGETEQAPSALREELVEAAWRALTH